MLTFEEFRLAVRVLIDRYTDHWDRGAEQILEREYKQGASVESAVSLCAEHLLSLPVR